MKKEVTIYTSHATSFGVDVAHSKSVIERVIGDNYNIVFVSGFHDENIIENKFIVQGVEPMQILELMIHEFTCFGVEDVCINENEATMKITYA